MNDAAPVLSAGIVEHSESALERAAFAKVAARLLPVLFFCYIVAYLDRVNVGFAKLQMAEALHFSDAVYGFGAGIFFIGYFLFEVPSNLILERVGARRWIARIMITWGIVSGAFAFVHTIPWGPLPSLFGVGRAEFSFYGLRFLLGIAEAGFFPGIILYLTYWFPSERRARTVALFMTAIAAANVAGAPLSGAILQYFDGAAGWAGWRWLFVIEAIPSLVAGVAVLALLPDGPSSARWLSDPERLAVRRRVAADTVVTDADLAAVTHGAVTDATRSNMAASRVRHDGGMRKANAAPHSARRALLDGRVLALALVYLAGTFSLYGVNFWMPTIVKELGSASAGLVHVGLLTMVPWAIAGIVMVAVGLHSDRTGERRWHVACSLGAIATGLGLLAFTRNAPLPSMIALTIATCGVMSFLATFWTVPTSFLRGSAAAAGIAWINSIGNLGGYFGPDLIGRVRAEGSSSAAFLALAGIAVVGAGIALLATRRASK